mgnify:CR=1 FL=1
MNNEILKQDLPSEEGLYKMKSPDGSIEVVRVENFVTDSNPNRPKNLHVVHINGEAPDDPDYYSVNSIVNDYDYMWQKV